MHRRHDPSGLTIAPLTLTLAAAALVLATAPCGWCQSRARETPVPWHLFDGVPAEPPVEFSRPEPVTPSPVVSLAEEVQDVPGWLVEFEPPVQEFPAPPEPAIEPPVAPPPAGTALLLPLHHAHWCTGSKVTIRWRAPQGTKRVRLYYYGEKCRLGGTARGSFNGVINADLLPNTGETQWRVPWLDGPSMNLRLAAYDDAETRLGTAEHTVWLYPEEFEGLPDNCIAISKKRQRLYLIRGGKTARMHMVSTAAAGYTTPKMKPGWRGSRGEMGRVFNKAPNPFSSLYEVNMPYWLGITSSGSHGIHATSPVLYSRLGGPASHGCVRQHRNDARILYSMVSVGTPVYIF